MARQVLPIVGAVIGAYFGGPQGAQIGYAIGSLVGNAVDPLMVDGPKIGDVANQTSSEGVYQPIYFGTAQGAGNIIAQGPNVIRRREESQGKGGGPITVTEYLYKTFAIRIGVSWKGETGIVGVTRIWENGKLVYDIRPGSAILAESTEFATKFRLYLGTDDQLPDPSLEAIYGVGNTPSYRGRAYIVFPLYDITAWKAIPQYLFEVVTGGVVTVASTVAVGGYSLGTGALNSDDGISWSGYFGPTPATFTNMMADEEKVIAWSTTKVSVSYDTGQTWTENPTNYFGGNLLRGAYNSGIYLISRAGPFGVLKSSDGFNYSVVDIGGQSTSVAINRIGICVAVQFRGVACRYSTGGVTWSGGGIPNPDPSYFSQFCNNIVSDGNLFITVGGDGNTLETYFISSTVTGVSWTQENVPFTEFGSRLEVLATGNGIWVCATGEGQIAWRDENEDWHLADDRFPGFPNDCTHNGEYFIMVGGETSASGTVIMYSADGNTWTAATHPEFSPLEAVASSVLTGEVTEDPPTLDQVIAAIHSWCGQPASEYDVSDLSDIVVRGYILSGGFTGKDAINTLQNLWMIDSPEYDKKIHYRKRGQNTVGTYTFDDLIDEPEDSTREQAIEYPKKLHLDYQSPDVDYAPAKATSSRSSIDARVIGEISVQVPVVLTPTEAFQRANVLHKVSWADADGEVIFSVPDENLHLVPGDCIQLFLRGSIRRLRIDKIEYFPGTLKLTCRGDRQSAYTSNVEGLTPPPPTPPPPSIVGPTMIVVGDWPALRDTDDVSTPVKYLALGGISPAWRGAQADESTDGGNTYTTILNVSSPSIMGTLTEDISDAAPYFTDTTNVLTIQLDIQDDSVELPTLTQQQFLTKNGGIALVKDDGTFELMQYRDSNDLGEGLFELSYLQRGRLNSTTSSFSAGDRFVLLSSVSVVPAPVSQIGLDMYYRATSYGQTLEDGTVVNEVFEGNSQTEWPVAHVILERSGDTINGTIVPRHRLGTETNPVRSINWTNYEITLQDSVDQFETLTQVSDTFSYDATSMTFPVTVTVYQVNRLTGAGPGKSEVIE